MIDYGELHAPTCVPRTRARVEPQEESGMVALAPPVLRLLPHALLWTLMLHAIGRTIAAPMARTAPASVPRVLQVHHVGDQAAAAAAGAVQLSPLFPLPRSSTLHPTATELIVSKNVSVVLDKSLYGAELTDTALVTKRVVPQIQSNGKRTVGVWMADRPNGAGGPEHVWPPPKMSDLPTGAVANVYQSMATAGPILDAGSPVVLSIAGSDWYLDYHPSFEDVYKVVPCAPSALDCASKPDRRKLLLGGSVSQWGESVDAFNFDADVWVGASALAERLWSDPPLGDNATLTSMTAQDRHHALSCHWKMWGVATYTRLDSHSEDTQVKDASLSSLCPADWSTPPV